MIIGLGEDLVDINRIEKLINKNGQSFLDKCFTPFEIQTGQTKATKKQQSAYYAKRFAAKEACLKALGTGMREGLSWHDMEIDNDNLGRPVLKISGGTQQALDALAKNAVIHITLSDEAGLAHATVILES